jgi:lysophospholipase L1-like esterase
LGTFSVPNPNAIGLLSRDYVNAIKAVGELYGIPVCDWYDNCGFNDLNKLTYYGDTSTPPYYLHPTNAGYKRMAEILIPFLKNN